MRKARGKPRRRRAVPSFSEHLMQRATREPALQHGIRPAMAERGPLGGFCDDACFDPRDVFAQTRKHARVCAAHAPLPCCPGIKKSVTSEPFIGPIVHDTF